MGRVRSQTPALGVNWDGASQKGHIGRYAVPGAGEATEQDGDGRGLPLLEEALEMPRGSVTIFSEVRGPEASLAAATERLIFCSSGTEKAEEGAQNLIPGRAGGKLAPQPWHVGRSKARAVIGESGRLCDSWWMHLETVTLKFSKPSGPADVAHAG